MNYALHKQIFAALFCGVCLWFGVRWFVGGTDNLASNIDLRSLSHLREDYQGTASDTATQQEPGKMTDPVSVGLQRLDRIPANPAQITDKEQEEDQEPSEEEIAADEQQEDQEQERSDNVVKEEGQPEESDVVTNATDPDDEDVPLTRKEKLEQEELIKTTSLDDEEIEAREAVRRKRLADLGLLRKKPPEPTIAVDASLEMPDRCRGASIARVPIGLKFRFESSIIKGESLNSLESLVALHRECGEGQFILAHNPLGREDATETLIQMRFNEVKYFFIQHSVPTDVVRFPEEQ